MNLEKESDGKDIDYDKIQEVADLELQKIYYTEAMKSMN